MAEGFAKLLAPTGTPIYSAGSDTANHTVNPLAIRAMKEVGIDISAHQPKGIDQVPMQHVGTVVTLCEGDCPEVSHEVRHLHWPIPDPNVVAELQDFREARDQIRELISGLF